MSKKRGRQHLKRWTQPPQPPPLKRVDFYDIALTVDTPTGKKLRERAAEVEEITQEIFELCSRLLWVTERDRQCLGIAAPQVGAWVRIFTVKQRKDTSRDGPGDRIYCFVNPTVEPASGALSSSETEGCYSMPGRKVLVERRTAVIVRGLSPDGSRIEVKLIGQAARAAQHEMDHLDGILIDHYGETLPVQPGDKPGKAHAR